MAQRLRELTPARSAVHALGAELRRLRMEKGLSQARLGELVHHSGALIGKIEKAERLPTPEFCELVDAALGTGGRLARMRPVADPRGHGVPTGVVEPAWAPGTSLRLLRELTGGSMERREFLTLTGATLAGLVASWSAATPVADLAAAVAGSGRLGGGPLDRVAARLAEMRALDDEMGSAGLRDVILAELRWLTELAGNPTRPQAEQRRLLGLIAEAGRLCGWAELDAGRQGPAQTHYVTALRCAADAADPLLGAHILAGMSLQATMTGRTRDALALVDGAEQRAGRNASPKLRALLESRRARAYAREGDARAGGLAMHRAEIALDAAGPGYAEPSWIYYMDGSELAAQAGTCWLDLGRSERAHPLLDGSLRTIAAEFVRDRSLYHSRLARAHLNNGELTRACLDLTAAVDLVRDITSGRAVATIRETRRAMSAHNREPIVREFDRVLGPAVGSAA